MAVAEAVVLRVAGGNAQFVLEHILSIDSLVHFTECLIVQHTGRQRDSDEALWWLTQPDR